jgi:hypothetical protein
MRIGGKNASMSVSMMTLCKMTLSILHVTKLNVMTEEKEL